MITLYLLLMGADHSLRWTHQEGASGELDQAYFVCMHRDSYGLMWFGSAEGLLRYDGLRARWYRHLPDENSLTPGTVTSILEATDGDFWIGTSGGLNRLDRVTGWVERFEPGTDGQLHSQNIWCLAESHDGKIWVGTDLGLEVLERGVFVKVPQIQSGTTALLRSVDGSMWIATESAGIFRADVNGNVSQINHELRVRQMVADSRGTIWLGTPDQGLWTWQETFKPFPLGPTEINGLESDVKGDIWVGTAQGLFQIAGLKREVISHQSPDPQEDPRIQLVHEDATGLVWVATHASGLYTLDLLHLRFHVVPISSGGANDLIQLQDGQLWVASKTGLIHVELESGDQELFMSGENARSLYAISDQLLLVGTERGLFQFDLSTRESQVLAKCQRVWDIALQQDEIWLATEQGIVIVQSDKEIRNITTDDGLSSRLVSSLCATEDGVVWVGTFGGGLSRVTSSQIETFQNEPQNAASLSADNILDLLLDTQGRLWIATLSGGLNLMNADHSFRRYMSPEFLPDNAVVALAQDHRGHLWLSTSAGAVRFDPNTESFVAYSDDDGMTLGSFTVGSVAVHGDRVWIGGSQAAVGFYPDDLGHEKRSELLVTDVMINNQDRYHLLPAGTPILLSADERSLSVNLTNLEFRSLPLNPSAYQRSDIDADWVFADQVSYTQYKPFGGEGTLRIKVADTYYRWQQFTIPIKVATPFWVRWLPLWILMTLTAVAFSTYAIANRRHRARQRKLIEAAEFERQRAQLAEDQRQVEVKARELQEEHNRVVQEYLEQLSNEIANDLHDGPLGRITGLGYQIRQWGQISNDEQLKEEFDEISQSAIPEICNHLRNLCGELITPDLKYGLIDEMERYAELVVAQTPGLTLETHWTVDEPELPADVQSALFRVARTLIKNVSKHAQAKKLVLSLTADAEHIMLSIRDDGKGFVVPASWDELKANRHYGMYLAHYFVSSLGGTMMVETQPERGTHISIKVPIRAGAYS